MQNYFRVVSIIVVLFFTSFNSFSQVKEFTFVKRTPKPHSYILEDESGMLWLAAHDSTYKFIRHVMNRTNLAPTRVFKINPNTKEVIEVYANEGGEISAGSTGLAYKDKLLISQVFEDFLLVCPRP